MAIYGSRGTSCFLGFPLHAGTTKMSTAIVRVLTCEGFVIAADGRQTDDDNVVITDSAQKLFNISSAARDLVCALCGTTVITEDANVDKFAWDLALEVRRASHSVSLRRSKNLEAYTARLCNPINEALRRANKTGRIKKYPCPKSGMDERGTTIAEVMLDGYFDGIPSRVSARFYHEDQKLRDPEITLDSLNIDGYYFHGSGKISAKLFEGNQLKTSSINNAIGQALRYIAICASPEGRQIDEDCPNIGGHVHIATIRPRSGFEWVPGREPITP